MYIVYCIRDIWHAGAEFDGWVCCSSWSPLTSAHWLLHHTVYFTIFSKPYTAYYIHCILHTVSILYTFHHTLHTLVPVDICNTSPPRFLRAPCTQPLMAPMMADWLLSLLRRCTNLWLTPRRNLKYWIPSHHHTHLKVLWRRGKLLWAAPFKDPAFLGSRRKKSGDSKEIGRNQLAHFFNRWLFVARCVVSVCLQMKKRLNTIIDQWLITQKKSCGEIYLKGVYVSVHQSWVGAAMLSSCWWRWVDVTLCLADCTGSLLRRRSGRHTRHPSSCCQASGRWWSMISMIKCQTADHDLQAN